MPEAPEVQNVLSWLEKELKGKTIVEAHITHPKLSDNMDPSEMEKRLVGQTFEGFQRHGKYLIFRMDRDDWISHLRMEGKFLIDTAMPEDPKTARHIHAQFRLNDGRWLFYYDTRKFGRMQLYSNKEPLEKHEALKNLGPDVLSPEFNGEWLYKKLQKKKCAVKTALLDQSIVAGIGNIYADEILYDAGLDPRSVCSHLDLEDCDRICAAAHRILQDSVRQGGTTIKSFEFGNHQPGQFQEQLKVHQQEGNLCRCGEAEIVRIKVGQRSTYLCPKCQKRK